MSTRAGAAKRLERPTLRVVGGGAARRSALVPFSIAVVLAVFAVAALQAYLGQEGFRAAQLERELKEQEERYALLRAEVAELSSPSRLEEEASELGMNRSAEPIFLPSPGDLPEAAGDGAIDFEAKRLIGGPP